MLFELGLGLLHDLISLLLSLLQFVFQILFGLVHELADNLFPLLQSFREFFIDIIDGPVSLKQ